jgi:hypothetical protein
MRTVSGRGRLIKGYGFIACASLAIVDGIALRNADNYRVFAMAVTLNQIDWTASNPMGCKP